jgi:sugar/nucleoside kinase (ribokinase family)
MPPAPVLAAGTLAWDTVARVQRLPADDEATRVTDRRERGGGAGANAAHALARMGHGGPLLTAYGPDFPRTDYAARLEEAGVDLGPALAAGDPTAHAWIFSGPDGVQRIYYDPGASPAAADCSVPGGAWEGWGHFAAGPIEVYPSLMGDVERVSFDPGQEVFHRDLDDVERCLPHVDVLLVNEHEADGLAAAWGREPDDLVGDEVEACVVTRGADPARLLSEEGVEEVPVPEAEVRDPTGAGDAHAAGLVAGLARGMDLADAVRLGNVVAGATVEAMGTQGGHPQAGEARDRYEAAYGSPPW